MGEIFYLWSVRSQGWMTKSSTYSTDLKEVKAFDREEALDMVKRQIEDGRHRMLAVPSSML